MLDGSGGLPPLGGAVQAEGYEPSGTRVTLESTGMGKLVRLLGAPRVVGGDQSLQPRGRKSWALLARLALASRPLSREELAQMLFCQAARPANALRWALADLRRSLERPDLLKGDPLELRPDAQLDIDVLHVDGQQALHMPELDAELLSGMEPEDCPEFSFWLTVERHRLGARLEDSLREGALRRAARGDWGGALQLAGRAVSKNALSEPLQELFIRCLAMSGDRRGALAQAQRVEELFLKELGAKPSVTLRMAAGNRAEVGGTPPASGRAAVRSLLEAGQAAVDAGAVDAGLDTLRRALGEAKRHADPVLGSRCALALGSALVHAVRGRDEEGAALLHEALVQARSGEQPMLAAHALRELGYVDVQAGRRRQAARSLDEASALAAGDDAALCAILGVRGMSLSDFGAYGEAAEVLQESVDRAMLCERRRQAAWSLSLLGRLHLLRDELEQARGFLERSNELAQSERWTAFAPWPQTLSAELLMRRASRDRDAIAESLQGTFALACQVADPCWEGVSARAIALLSSQAGDRDEARHWMHEADTRANRVVDLYVWVQAYVLEGQCQLLLLEGREAELAERAARLAELSARTEQREHLVRALSYQGRAGNPTARIQAQAVAREVDNPALHGWLEQ
ncbi:MAG: hypothetical protein OEZ06_22605 [Myxococcales bacterium]|nr:hypothetical protein [Myxococcales bacterium]